MKPSSDPSGRPVRDRQRGQALVFFALLLVVLLSAAAFVVDIGDLYFSYQELQGATNSAALAGGAAIIAGTAVNTAYQYSGDPNSPANATYNVHANLNITGVTVTLGCISTATYPNLGLPPCSVYGSQASANAVQVVETASVGTYFAKIFGVSSVNVTATATASAKGGNFPTLPRHAGPRHHRVDGLGFRYRLHGSRGQRSAHAGAVRSVRSSAIAR